MSETILSFSCQNKHKCDPSLQIEQYVSQIPIFSRNHHFRRWIIKAPHRLVLIGAGSCPGKVPACSKYSGAATLDRVMYGTFARIILNSGVSAFGDAVKHRVLNEQTEQNSF